MGRKKGPCRHCGIDYTPLWRNGPEDKPVLCNACGSRYRLSGTLDDYLPKNFQPEQLNNLINVEDGSNHNVKSKYSGGIDPSLLWDCKIPSRKRSRVVYREVTPMDKFLKQLLNLWRNQRKPDESSSEEVLLLHNVNNFIPRNEIGLGGILLKPNDTSKRAL